MHVGLHDERMFMWFGLPCTTRVWVYVCVAGAQWRSEDKLSGALPEEQLTDWPKRSVSLLRSPRIMNVLPCLRFYMVLGVNLGIHTCILGALLTELSPQLLASKFLFKFSLWKYEIGLPYWWWEKNSFQSLTGTENRWIMDSYYKNFVHSQATGMHLFMEIEVLRCGWVFLFFLEGSYYAVLRMLMSGPPASAGWVAGITGMFHSLCLAVLMGSWNI